MAVQVLRVAHVIRHALKTQAGAADAGRELHCQALVLQAGMSRCVQALLGIAVTQIAAGKNHRLHAGQGGGCAGTGLLPGAQAVGPATLRELYDSKLAFREEVSKKHFFADACWATQHLEVYATDWKNGYATVIAQMPFAMRKDRVDCKLIQVNYNRPAFLVN